MVRLSFNLVLNNSLSLLLLRLLLLIHSSSHLSHSSACDVTGEQWAAGARGESGGAAETACTADERQATVTTYVCRLYWYIFISPGTLWQQCDWVFSM